MPYDYFLESENEQRIFSKKTFEEMHKYIINNLPHYHIEDWFYYIFKDDNSKERGIRDIDSTIAKNRNIYIYSSIAFFPTKIRLSVIGDNDVDCHLYEFVVWCQENYPCQLYEGAEPVPAEDLLSEEEEIPLID